MTPTDSAAPLPLHRRVCVRLSIWIAAAAALAQDLGFALAREVFWLGAAKERQEYDARRAALQDEIARVLVDALVPEPLPPRAPAGEYVQ